LLCFLRFLVGLLGLGFLRFLGLGLLGLGLLGLLSGTISTPFPFRFTP
jgi:hypothetical protein